MDRYIAESVTNDVHLIIDSLSGRIVGRGVSREYAVAVAARRNRQEGNAR